MLPKHQISKAWILSIADVCCKLEEVLVIYGGNGCCLAAWSVLRNTKYFTAHHLSQNLILAVQQGIQIRKRSTCFGCGDAERERGTPLHSLPNTRSVSTGHPRKCFVIMLITFLNRQYVVHRMLSISTITKNMLQLSLS